MQIPTLIVNNGDVLDVIFTEWGHDERDNYWYITTETNLPTSTSEASHIVFELPIGCYMIDLPKTEYLTRLGPAGTGPFIPAQECNIPRKLRQEMVAEATQEINAGTPVES